MPSGSYTGASSHRFTYRTTHGRSVFASTALMIRSLGTLSKNFWMSRSITQFVVQQRRRQTSTASNAVEDFEVDLKNNLYRVPDTAWPISGHPPGSSRDRIHTPVLMSTVPISTLHRQ